MDERDLSLTVEEYIEGLRLTDKFKQDFIYPFLLAGWCVDPVEFRRFMAYNVLRYS
jgi:predicted NAD/FAD-binding protein